jgi:hypothetical protein
MFDARQRNPFRLFRYRPDCGIASSGIRSAMTDIATVPTFARDLDNRRGKRISPAAS